MSGISVTEFFHSIAADTIKLVQDNDKKTTLAENKGAAGNYATQLDIDVENLIIAEINKHFPKDQILAEEGYSNVEISNERIWIIDPICGTNNLGKGINNFCTNIALADRGKVIAACVVDHSQDEYIWSVGEGEVYVNSNLYSAPSPDMGQKVDVDYGSVREVDRNLRDKHNKSIIKLVEETDYDIISLNTSLSFAYIAIGKTDGCIHMFDHPWDIAAPSFLIQQSGGVLTGLDGSEWTLATTGAIGGRTPEVHKELLNLFL